MDAAWPIWSRDGRYVYFSADQADVTEGRDGFRVLADGSAGPEPLFRLPGPQVLADVSADGSQLVLSDPGGGTSMDIRTLSFTPDGPIVADYLSAPWNEGYGRISPDGSALAYLSGEPGAGGIYVRSFPEPSDAATVPTIGEDPVWSPDGTALYYLLRGALWRTAVGGDEVGGRRQVFEGRWVTYSGASVANFDVHPDGASFVFVKDPQAESSSVGGGPPPADLEVVVNWFDELRERMGR
jgi:Tol biopolymer transport system component